MSYDTELEFAKSLATEAGKIMRRYFRADDIGTEWKADNTPLTVADKAINSFVIHKVRENFPDQGVIGEEESFKTERQYVWVVDPIDGTMPFSIGIPVSTFSLGLVDKSDGQAIVATVYDPQLDELYTAIRGQGSFLNDKPLHTSANTEFKNTYLSIIGGTNPENKNLSFGKVTDLAKAQHAKPLCLYSQVYSAAKVASGDLVGSIFGYGSPWDSAAVSLLVEEAGGKVTDLEGKQRRFDEWGNGCILAANEAILTKLLGLLRTAQ